MADQKIDFKKRLSAITYVKFVEAVELEDAKEVTSKSSDIYNRRVFIRTNTGTLLLILTAKSEESLHVRKREPKPEDVEA